MMKKILTVICIVLMITAYVIKKDARVIQRLNSSALSRVPASVPMNVEHAPVSAMVVTPPSANDRPMVVTHDRLDSVMKNSKKNASAKITH